MSPVETGSSEETHAAAVQARMHAVAVEFDFMQPSVAVRRGVDARGASFQFQGRSTYPAVSLSRVERGSYPADRRETGSCIKCIGSLTPGNEGFGHLFQFFSRCPAPRDRQPPENAAQPDHVILGDPARLLKRAGRRSCFCDEGARCLR